MAKKYSFADAFSMIIDGNSSDMEQLGEDEDDDEDWTPNAKLTEGSSDSDSEEEESVDQMSTEIR